jgi:integrase/recombinase XerD
MKLAAAVEIYVLHRQGNGQKFQGPLLRSARFPVVTAKWLCRRSRLDGGEAVPGCAAYGAGSLATKIWGFAGLLRVLAVPWKAEYAVPMPLAAPKYTQTFVPYIYSRRELRLLLDAVPRCQRHAACRTAATHFAPCCCSSTERVCGWVKRCGCAWLTWISTTV